MEDPRDLKILAELVELERLYGQELFRIRRDQSSSEADPERLLRSELRGTPAEIFSRERKYGPRLDVLPSRWAADGIAVEWRLVPFALIRIREARRLLSFLGAVRSDPFPPKLGSERERRRRILVWLLSSSWPEFGLPNWRMRWREPVYLLPDFDDGLDS